MKPIILFALLAFLCGQTCVAADAPPLNILILYADDMGFGDLGANNPASTIPTPNLDRLATEGLRFTDANSLSGICTPGSEKKAPSPRSTKNRPRPPAERRGEGTRRIRIPDPH